MMRMFLHPSTHPPYTGDSVFIGPGTSPPTDAYICSSSHAYLLVGGLVPGSSWGSCWGVGWLQLGAIQSPHLTIPEVLFPASTCTYFLPALAHRPSAFYQQMMLLHSTQQIFSTVEIRFSGSMLWCFCVSLEGFPQRMSQTFVHGSYKVFLKWMFRFFRPLRPVCRCASQVSGNLHCWSTTPHLMQQCEPSIPGFSTLLYSTSGFSRPMLS